MFFKEENIINDNYDIICHSGGAIGSDTYWETIGEQYNVKTKAYSYKTDYHNSKNKIEISDNDYIEGVDEIIKANKILNRQGINKYLNLLARNWSQVKYSDEIFAIGYIVNPGDKDSKGYINNTKCQIVSGGTGYAIAMGINNEKDIYVFEQKLNKWFKHSYISSSFIELKNSPKISYNNFAGIGTREIKQNGINAIKDVYKNTFNK